MKILIHEPRPRWYRLSWSEKDTDPEIIIGIHRDFAREKFTPIAVTAPLVVGTMQKLDLRGTFTGDLGGEYFGFSNSLIRQPDEGDYIILAAPLHQVRKPTGRRCMDCRGAGRSR